MKKEESASQRELDALRFATLVRSLGLLAVDARAQIDWLNSFDLPGEAAYAEELADEFTECLGILERFVENGWVNPRAIGTLKQIEDIFTQMGESGSTDIWAVEQLQTSDQWQSIRTISARALVLL